MAHYDFLNDRLTEEDITKRKQREQDSLQELGEKKKELEQDILLVQHESTKRVITRDIEDVERRIEKKKKTISEWDNLLQRLQIGEKVTEWDTPRSI